MIAGDTDSLFLNGNDCDGNRLFQFIAECKAKIGVHVEHSQTFVKAAIIKKKHYFGVTTHDEIKVVEVLVYYHLFWYTIETICDKKPFRPENHYQSCHIFQWIQARKIENILI